jgi:hypothetical protein
MSKQIVETIYSKHHKYDVIQETSTLGSPKYYVKRSDGKVSGMFFAWQTRSNGRKRKDECWLPTGLPLAIRQQFKTAVMIESTRGMVNGPTPRASQPSGGATT